MESATRSRCRWWSGNQGKRALSLNGDITLRLKGPAKTFLVVMHLIGVGLQRQLANLIVERRIGPRFSHPTLDRIRSVLEPIP